MVNTPTTNHKYNKPSRGDTDWGVALNNNFDDIDADIMVRDLDANKSDYTPISESIFLSIDTKILYIGDGSEWVQLADLTNQSGSRYSVKNGTGSDIQAAIDSANADGGGKVILGSSEFLISSTIIKPANVGIVGQGESTVLRLADGANTDIIKVVNDDYRDIFEGIRYLKVEGNLANNSFGRGVVIEPFALRFQIDNVRVYETPGNGIEYTADANQKTYEPIITQSEVEDCGGDGLVVSKNVYDLYLENLSVTNCQRGAVIAGGGHSLFHIHAVRNRSHGIVFSECDGAWLYDIYGDTNDGHGIYAVDTNYLLSFGGAAFQNGMLATPMDGLRLSNSSNNRFVGLDLNEPRSISNKTQRHGVREIDNSTSNTFAFCLFRGNRDAAFIGSKDTTHIDNTGYKTKVSGEFNGTGDGSTMRFDAGRMEFGTIPTDPADIIMHVSSANYNSASPIPIGAAPGYNADDQLTRANIYYAKPPSEGVNFRAKWVAELNP